MQNDDRSRDEKMTLEEIINFLKSMPKSKYKIVDTVKYRKMQSAAEKCRELFCTDNFEIVPHTDGTLEFNLAFQSMLKSM
ncbi:MAG: hypothetical protein LUI10_12265 [Lachnospiraceae bacterium]|nr:hypothetical protein [Lachnospiraceae bacterium]